MERRRRVERLIAVTRYLVEHPCQLISLSTFGEELGAAKSSLSEDIGLIKRMLDREGEGWVETVPGAAGGVRYLPELTGAGARTLVASLAQELSHPARFLPGGFLYLTDILFTPVIMEGVGRIFAGRFRLFEPEWVVTVETKGIPVALFTARALGVPAVIIRHESRVTEGPAVSINYLSGSTRRIQTMSLPRRALPSGARVVVVDDFMRAGGTARGMHELMAEFGAHVLGTGVLMATREPENKLVPDYFSLLVLEEVKETGPELKVRPAAWLEGG
ncbi:MAG TPA: pur operon repressor [Firmicutes bacterium]|jgi:purine operon repressor|uniref:pur operon repressor n=1 Tax=Gelria sp. Kuro-4 TaxID=2796927 RepID=UPI0019B33D0E|nr:pur operon repressor [Gelria sp. Kuro-4]MDK2927716.1 purine operon repressor [Bacillota bacterium]BCV23527.1 pur operon repressor [Gelria sp. Kuro-4]HHV57116.1 pur operon repressor [Bacillota bacterium]